MSDKQRVIINNTKQPNYLSFRRIVLLALSISVGFHLLFFLTMSLGDTIIGVSLSQPKHSADAVSHRFIRTALQSASMMAASFMLILCLFLYNRKIISLGIPRKSMEYLILIVGSLLLTCIISISLSMLIESLHHPHFWEKKAKLLRIIIGGMVRDLSFAALVIVIVQLLRSLNRERVIAVENEMLRTQNANARFNALKSQMNPHFLFNSLNTLQSLIDTNTDAAERYVQQLSHVMRYSLQEREVVTLEEEERCVRAYCQMMQIRYGSDLVFDFSIAPTYASHKVLPLSLQGLVENAIKHNVISAKQPLTIRIDTDIKGQVRVSNRIKAKLTNEPSSGIGLANLSERYRLMWNVDITISNNGQVFEVLLPLIFDK